MAARRKKPEETVEAAYRSFTVALENMQGQFRAFGERLCGVEATMTAGFARVDERLDRVEYELKDVHHDLGLVKTAVLEHNAILKGTVRRDEVEAMVDRAVARRRR